ncbi:MAG: hypothetical protein L0H79_12540 [Intrasporangium sp.]|uniref:hypothetical protein n=1 Tax=Intrasporangium sp. TaxID=1925024 RepID=UPI002648AED7|nr:hypothetical protein [Intrasporangium sp.]MDN5796567.1 hypothetical protein [Intrasporangium sp.]
MAIRYWTPHSRAGRVKLVIAGCVAAMAVFALDVTLAVLAILALGGTAAGLALFRGKGSWRLSRFFAGALLGTALYVIFAWYGVATSPPVLQTQS